MHKTHYKLLVCLMVFLCLIVIPTSFAADADTDLMDDTIISDDSIDLVDSVDADSLDASNLDNEALESTGSNDVLEATYYFDSNATKDGNGTKGNPYKYLNSSRIKDGSVISLSNGEYVLNLSSNNYFSDLKIIGKDATKTIIKGNKKTSFKVQGNFVLQNLTLDCAEILLYDDANLTASNVIFCNGKGDDNYRGGAISTFSPSSPLFISLNNCSFYNNSATYGGAIYLETTTAEIINCKFINNTATSYGGAIAALADVNKKLNLTIKSSQFINDKSRGDAGGALYLKAAKFVGSSLTVSNCSSTFGGAFTFLNVNAKVTSLKGINNTASYDGGVIYQMYGNLTVSKSTFTSNNAKNGAGIFADGLYNLTLTNNTFINNSAVGYGGAIYSLLVNKTDINNSYANNTASNSKYNDLYKSSTPNLNIKDSNYTMYFNDEKSSTIPTKYNSTYVTSIKDQSSGGNCWAFASIATLESCILKASGEALDLSEENMKNIAELYSVYGWNQETNDGGYDDMALGYLLSWLGPVYDADDKYDPKSTLSPVLSSIMHVQNVMYLKRDSYTDNAMIKRAIMDNGAVFAPVYLKKTAITSSSFGYYKKYDNETSPNHAVVLIGWDDNIQIPDAPGKGAWIVKNSWGNSNNKGYFYLSYYDKSSIKLKTWGDAFTFVLNDTIKFDKNYQYDIAKTDYFFNTTKTAWYKNSFKATSNEYLMAASTYFEKKTTYQLSVVVNNVSKLVQAGVANPGYWTINLNKPIPLNSGDVFEIMFKINVSGDVGVPISEAVSLNNIFFKKGVSFISFDGKNWVDLYNLRDDSYPGHTYTKPQVACIKAFTVLNKINTTISLSVKAMDDNGNKMNPVNITAKVLNQYGHPVNCGQVKFNLSGKIVYANVSNGKAKITDYIFEEGQNTIFAEFVSSAYNSPLASSSVEITKYHVNMSAKVTQGVYSAFVNITLTEKINETISFILGYKNFTVKSVNGKASINLTGLSLGLNNLTIVLDPARCVCNEIQENFTVKTTVSLPKYNNFTYGSKYSIKFLDNNLNPLKNTNVTITFGTKTYKLKTNGSGIVRIDISSKPGTYKIKVKNPKTLEAKNHTIKIVARIDQNKNMTMYYGAGKYYKVRVLDNYGNIAKNVSVKFTLNGKTYYKRTNSKGIASLKISLKPKAYTVSASYKGFTVKNKITVKSTIITKNISRKKAKTIKFTAKLVNSKGTILKYKYIKFKFKSKTYKRKTNSKGIATLSLKYLKKGKYVIYSTYGTLTVKNTIRIT